MDCANREQAKAADKKKSTGFSNDSLSRATKLIYSNGISRCEARSALCNVFSPDSADVKESDK
jgi:hypothetical protein